ncbi:hypothetical protein ACFSCV_16885 [Methylopila henanensis]|uniref:Histidine kinase n=1 Tax=Methylopila henanensis TaxID=873516 RepID=A0ABW4K936_9HYPH
MADYFPVLSRAVAGLPANTGENRRAVYERARAAIIRQLRSIDPPLSEDDISRERMRLEEAIARVEEEHGGGAAAPAPAAKPAEPAPKAPPPPPQRRPEPAADAAPPPQRAPAPRRGPEVRADGRPIIRAAGEAGTERPQKSRGPLVAVAALAVVAIVAGVAIGRDHIAALFGGGETQTAATDTTGDGAKNASTPEPATPSNGGKSDDRLLSDPAPQAEPGQPPETNVARAPDAGPGTEPQAPAAQPQPQAPAAQPSQQPNQPAGPLVAQRAILYEEGSDQKSGEQVDGSVLWRTESVNAAQGQPLETALRGDVEVPARGIRATLTIRRNTDATLPASHTVEIQFRLPENFPNAGVANVPGILMKTDEAARGAPISGLSVRVTSGFFLIGLSNIENERIVNEQLLRDRGWIDIPILYDNGRRAVLTLEKGTPGGQAFADAFAAWQNAAASAPAGQSQP